MKKHRIPARRKRHKFVVCIDNEGYPASLERRKIYEVLVDTDAEELGLIRVIDESGEDYLFPSDFFVAIQLAADVANAVRKAS